MPGNRAPSCIREHGAQRDRAGALALRDAGEFQPSRFRVPRAIFEQQAHAGAVCIGPRQRTGAELPPQPQHLGRGLCQVDIHWCVLLHRGQCAALVGSHQRAFRERGRADASGDGRDDARIAQIDARGFLCRARDRLLRLCLAQACRDVVPILLADVARGCELLVAFIFLAHRERIGIGARYLRRGAIVGRLIGGRIQLIERLSGLDQRPFREQATPDDAARPAGAPGQSGTPRCDPGSCVAISERCGCTTTTPTSGGAPVAPCSPDEPQPPLIVVVAASTARQRIRTVLMQWAPRSRRAIIAAGAAVQRHARVQITRL